MTTTEQAPTPPPTEAEGQTERAWLLVARREVTTRLTDKSFLIGTLLTLVVMVGFLGWTAYDDGRTDTVTVAATADGAATADLLASGVPDVDDGLDVKVVEVASDDEGVAALEDEDADVLLRPSDDGWTLVGKDEVSGDFAAAAGTVIRDATLTSNAEDAGTSLTELQQGSSVDTELLDGDAERKDFARGMGFALAFLFYLAALGFGYTLSGSIVEEKANRIVEIITTKIPVRQLLIGKIAGNTLLALGQTALLVAVGLVGISFTEYGEFLSAIGPGVGWFAVFFLVGFTFIACWWAVAGALASRAEDLQTTATPLTFLMMAVFFGAFLFEGTALTVASYVPPFSIVLMPIRVLNGDAAVWEPIVAIVLLIGAMAATVVFAERIYRRALLQTQGRVTLQAGLDGGRLNLGQPGILSMKPATERMRPSAEVTTSKPTAAGSSPGRPRPHWNRATSWCSSRPPTGLKTKPGYWLWTAPMTSEIASTPSTEASGSTYLAPGLHVAASSSSLACRSVWFQAAR